MHIFRKTVLIFVLLTYTLKISAQILNAYAKVSVISGTTLTLTNVNTANHVFNIGEQVVIMQMQGDVIGANTTNAATFGDLSAIANTGLYEIRTITARTGTAAAPTDITLDNLINTYDINANSSVQVITFRQLAVGDYTTTSNITALAWDGNVGGVVAIQVGGVLTLNHNITANGIGFRGGARSTNNNGTQCVAANVGLYRNNDVNTGYKGEGIYKNTNVNYNNQRAKILTGGGGGVHHNSGGGGGGNYTAGGMEAPVTMGLLQVVQQTLHLAWEEFR